MINVKCKCGSEIVADEDTIDIVPDWGVKELTVTCGECDRIVKVSITAGYVSGQMYREKEWLQTEYLDEGRSMSDIARECDTSAMTIHHWLRRHEIPTRKRGAPQKGDAQ